MKISSQRLKVNNGLGVCTKCGEELPLERFHVQRCNAAYPYGLTYCDKCRKQQIYDALNSDARRYLNDRHARLLVRATKEGLKVKLSREEFQTLYTEQDGCCFYSGIKMRCRVGEGYSPDSLSIDRINPDGAYEIGNIVLCTNRMNTVKSNLSLIELKKWIPSWYEKIQIKLGE